MSESWQDMLEAVLLKKGVEGVRALEGYWVNEEDEAQEAKKGSTVEMKWDSDIGYYKRTVYQGEPPKTHKEMTMSAIHCLICNLQDSCKDDAISQLVDLLAEEVL